MEITRGNRECNIWIINGKHRKLRKFAAVFNCQAFRWRTFLHGNCKSAKFAKLCPPDHTNTFFAFLTGLSKAVRRAPRRTSPPIVYSIKLLPTLWTSATPGTAGSQEYLSLIRTLIRAPRKVHGTTPASLRGKTFSILFEKTRNHRVVAGTPLNAAAAACCRYMAAHKASRDTIDPRIHKGR